MALRSIGANRLRTILTLLSIAIGVFAIIGVAAAIDMLQASINTQYEALGGNAFIIQQYGVLGPQRRGDDRPNISLRTAEEFKQRMAAYAGEIGLSYQKKMQVVKREAEETNPEITVVGSDETFSSFNDYTVEEGRMIDPSDVQTSANVVVLGADVARKLYPNSGSAVNSNVTMNGQRYRVIGVLAPKGAIGGQSQDKLVAVPITNAAHNFFDEWDASVSVSVRAGSRGLEETQSQAVGIMRILRRLELDQENNFEIVTNESMNETFGPALNYLNLFGLACGIIALIAAGVGIMNMMLVSVKERTREIGIRKAIGASRRVILTQFLVEAVTLCQLGAWIGIILAVVMTSLLALMIEASVSIPWGQIISSVVVCTLIGVVFGIYPAWRAARLDPIDALRYE